MLYSEGVCKMKKKKYEKPKLISAAEVDEMRKLIDQKKAIIRSLKRDGMTDEEIEAFFQKAVERSGIYEQ